MPKSHAPRFAALALSFAVGCMPLAEGNDMLAADAASDGTTTGDVDARARDAGGDGTTAGDSAATDVGAGVDAHVDAGDVDAAAPVDGWRTAWGQLAGAASFDPALVQTADHVVHAFVRARADGALLEAHTSDGVTWSAWSSGGGAMLGAPSAIVAADGRVYVFARASNAKLTMRAFDPTAGWIKLTNDLDGGAGSAVDWIELGPQSLAFDPVVTGIARGDGSQEIDAFAAMSTAANGAPEMWRLAASSASGSFLRASAWLTAPGCASATPACWRWMNLHGALYAPPTPSSRPYYAAAADATTGITDIVVADVNQNLFVKTCSSLDACSVWIGQLDLRIGSAPAAIRRRRVSGSPVTDIVVMGEDRHFHFASFAAGAWSSWTFLNGDGYSGVGTSSAPALVEAPDGALLTFVQDQFLNFFWSRFTQGSWTQWNAPPDSTCVAAGGRAAAVMSNDPAHPRRVYAVVLDAAGNLESNTYDEGGTLSGNTLACACGQVSQSCCNRAQCGGGTTCGGDNVCAP